MVSGRENRLNPQIQFRQQSLTLQTTLTSFSGLLLLVVDHYFASWQRRQAAEEYF